MKNKKIRLALLVLTRVALGLLFVYGGIKKFDKTPRKHTTEASVPEPDNKKKIKSFIGGMKQTGYFWPFLGVLEITGGLLLLTQVLALLGAFILLPICLNIFLFHLFLEPHETGELWMTGLYLVGNVFIITMSYKKLKPVFFNYKILPS